MSFFGKKAGKIKPASAKELAAAKKKELQNINEKIPQPQQPTNIGGSGKIKKSTKRKKTKKSIKRKKSTKRKKSKSTKRKKPKKSTKKKKIKSTKKK